MVMHDLVRPEHLLERGDKRTRDGVEMLAARTADMLQAHTEIFGWITVSARSAIDGNIVTQRDQSRCDGLDNPFNATAVPGNPAAACL